ncbi:MAG: hypothetical protein ACKVQC_04390 [Elusimicrobiota bacterium]
MASHPSLLFASTDDDQIENLIVAKQQEDELWKDRDGDLPETTLSGDKQTVEIFSDRMELATLPLCTGLELDEFLDIATDQFHGNILTLDFSNLKLRQYFIDHCLVRPDDMMTAVGKTNISHVTIAGFQIRRSLNQCETDRPFTLEAVLDEPLIENPIFFTTDLKLSSGTVQFYSVESLKKIPLGDNLRIVMKKQIPFLDEFSTESYELSHSSSTTLIWLKRKNLTPDDEGLSSEVLLSWSDQRLETLLQTKVSLKEGTGHLKINGVFDFDRDGFDDLFISGDQAHCPFELLFRGSNNGFIPYSLPLRRCKC